MKYIIVIGILVFVIVKKWKSGIREFNFLKIGLISTPKKRNLDGLKCLEIVNYLEKLNGRFTIN